MFGRAWSAFFRHKFISSLGICVLGSQLIDLGLESIGGPLLFIGAPWFVFALAAAIGGSSGRQYLPGTVKIDGVTYSANSREASNAQWQVDNRRT
ncbi:hypothetical protein [Geodermatophilus nigrescens]|uniref:Uncharacterized protein n=1 Tax=Geodermatophilus nigrescens TaxID=1070870 RepID=A0A1M5ICB7_9ACTN|nr:hypothetical protein [Geodermatophilus nigrescens]SHG25413.1 hypothetical protein SAMN05444351_1991 [Geodermatophilus nigrescens]